MIFSTAGCRCCRWALRDRTPRHRSLQATIEWSYELCSSTEKLLWNRVASFADGFDLDMVVDVCSDDALPASVVLDSLAALVAKSVLLRDGDGRHVRFRMLESIREFGWGKLTAAERLAMSTRLLDWCARLIIDCAEHWYGPDQLAKAARVQENRGNIRAALHSALDDPDDGRGRAAAEALGAGRFLWACGISVREHRLWLTQALEDCPTYRRSSRDILGVLGLVQTLQGDRDAAGFTLHRAGVIAEREHDVMNRAFVTHTSGLRDYFAGDFDSARVNLDAAARDTPTTRARPSCSPPSPFTAGCCCRRCPTPTLPPRYSARCSPRPRRSTNGGSTPMPPTGWVWSRC